MTLTPAQRRVLERLAANEGLYYLRIAPGEEMYAWGGFNGDVSARVADRLKDAGLVTIPDTADWYAAGVTITDAGRRAPQEGL